MLDVFLGQVLHTIEVLEDDWTGVSEARWFLLGNGETGGGRGSENGSSTCVAKLGEARKSVVVGTHEVGVVGRVASEEGARSGNNQC